MKPYLIHKPKPGGSYGLKNRDGKNIVDFHTKKADEFYILRVYGREVLEQVNRTGSWEDKDKEIAIVKLELPTKEAPSTLLTS